MMAAAALHARPAHHDPATRLTPAERAFVAWLNAHKTRDQVLAALEM